MKRENKLLVILVFTALLMGLEIFGGLLSGSLALLGDAGHMFTDSMAIFLSYLALLWSKKPPTPKKTFGYHRIEIIAAFVNGFILLMISGYIFYEAVNRFFHPAAIKPGILLTIAVIGLIGNVIGMLVLKTESRENLNIRSTFLHLLGDMLSSIGVVIGGIIILFTGWGIVDSLIGLMIGGVILRSTINLIFESSEILLEAVPHDIDLEQLRKAVESISGIKEFHDIHVWTITTGRRVLSGHLLIENISTKESQKILRMAKEILLKQFNIAHTTLEVECDKCENNPCVT